MSASYILVVEDDPDVAETLCEVLQLKGYQVAHSADGQEALTRLASGALPKLILLDLMMPRTNGYSFRKAQLSDARIASIPVVVMSADRRSQTRIAELRAAHYLTKPLDLQLLFEVIEKHIAPPS